MTLKDHVNYHYIAGYMKRATLVDVFVCGHLLYTSGFDTFLVSICVWAMSSMLDVSVRMFWWLMRMLPQHLFAKDRYLWSMLCLCCKLALPTTWNRELISFFFFNKCKPDSSGLNIIADTICMRFHLVLYHIYIFQVFIVSFDILIF